MDLKNLTPKDKELYMISSEWMESFTKDLEIGVVPEDFKDIIMMMRRSEYKRGKADGVAEFDIKIVRQCMDFKGLSCDNKGCTAESCPLNKIYD